MLEHLTRLTAASAAFASLAALAGCSPDSFGGPSWRLGGPRNVAERPASLGYAPGSVGPSGAVVIVRSGDTLASLSRRHAVPVADLMAVNGLRDGAIVRGQILLLPATH
jgi:LysM repeat protein